MNDGRELARSYMPPVEFATYRNIGKATTMNSTPPINMAVRARWAGRPRPTSAPIG